MQKAKVYAGRLKRGGNQNREERTDPNLIRQLEQGNIKQGK